MQDTDESAIVLTGGGINRVTLLEKIKGLHADVDGSALDWWRKNLHKLIQLGADLTALKEDVGHGAWLAWFRANAGFLGFSEDTAENYMRLFKYSDRLANSGNVRNLTDALLLIREPDPEKRQTLVREAEETGESIRKNQSRHRATKRAKKDQKPSSDPTRTAVIDALCALGIEYEVAAQWAEAAKGETVEDLIKDALRRRAKALEASKDPPEVPGPDTVGGTAGLERNATYKNQIVETYEDKPDFVHRQMKEEEQLKRKQEEESEYDWLLLHQTEYTHLVQRARHYLNITEQKQFDRFIKKNPVI
jgi:Protein of unknown function (DUF3102)